MQVAYRCISSCPHPYPCYPTLPFVRPFFSTTRCDSAPCTYHGRFVSGDADRKMKSGLISKKGGGVGEEEETGRLLRCCLLVCFLFCFFATANALPRLFLQYVLLPLLRYCERLTNGFGSIFQLVLKKDEQQKKKEKERLTHVVHPPCFPFSSFDRSLFKYFQTVQSVVVIIIVVFTDSCVCGVMN